MSRPVTSSALNETSLAVPAIVPVSDSTSPCTDSSRAGQIGWIFGEIEESLLRYARRFTGNLDRARDAVQETFLEAYRKDLSQVQGHLIPWLFQVCRNRALDVQRKERRIPVTRDVELDSLPDAQVQSDRLVALESMAQLDELLEKLTVQQRNFIVLRFQGGLSYREIAHIADTTVSNVGFHLHMGLKQLRQLMTS